MHTSFRRGLVIGLSLLLVACGAQSPSANIPSGAPSSGQGSSPGANGEPLQGTLTFVYGSFAPQAKWEAYFEAFLSANPGVTIEYIPVSLDDGWGVYSQKIATLLAGGQSLDVIWVASEGVPSLASKGVLAPLDSLIEADEDDPELADYLADVSPVLLDALKWQDQQFLMPFAWNNMVVWYNPELLEAAGLDTPSADWTWDDYLEYAKALTVDTNGDGEPEQWGAMVDDGWFTTAPWFFTNGTSPLNEDYTEAQLDGQAAQETLQFLYDLVYRHRVSPQPPTDANQLFLAGKLAMFGGGRWPLETLVPADFTDFEIAPFPQNENSGTVLGSDGYGVAANSANPELAWELVKYLGGTDVMEALLGGEAASGSIPARRSLATSDRMAPPNNFNLFYDSLEYARPVPTGPYFPELSGVFQRYMSSLMANEITVDDAAAAMQEEMTQILASGG